jgi:biotin/methionine sulfoxide reductase
VVQLASGAWLDLRHVPGVGPVCIHGNPNVLTEDRGTSSLAQGPVGQVCLVEVERYAGEAPEVRVWESNPVLEREKR